MNRFSILLTFLKSHWLLVVLPLMFGFGAYQVHLSTGELYQSSVDPEYTIIYNGIIVSTGSFSINFIHHPATPTIFISGLSSLILRPFSDTPTFVEDFINSPGKYLQAAHFLQIFIILITALWGSFKLKKHTNSIIGPLLLGLALVSHYSLFEIGSRLIPETTIFIPLLLITALLIIYIYKGDQVDLRKKMLWQFPLLIAFGIACKLSFLPMFIIPFLILGNSRKNIWKIVRNTFLFTLLFAYPLFTNYEESTRWISNIFRHSGNHGTGAENFIALSTVPENFKLMLGYHPTFWILLGINFILLIKLYTQSIASSSLLRFRKVLLSITLSICFLTLMVLKHFALHYFLPFYLLVAVLIFFPIFYLKTTGRVNLKFIYAGAIIFSLFLMTQSYINLGELIADKEKIALERDNRQKAVLNQIKEQNAALIIDAPYWGTPFPEYAHSFGFMHSYKRKTYFKNSLREKYPNFYLNVGWMDEFNHWDKFVGYEYIFEQSPVVYIYAGPTTKGLESIVDRLTPLKTKGAKFKEELIWRDDDNARLMRIEKL